MQAAFGRSFKGVPKKSQEDQLDDLDLSSLAEELDSTGGLKSLDSIPSEAATAGASPEGRKKLQLIGVTWCMASVFFLKLANHVDPVTFWDKVVLEVEAKMPEHLISSYCISMCQKLL